MRPRLPRWPGIDRSSRSRAGEEAHRVAVASNLQPVAVLLDFVDPIRAGWRLQAEGRQAGRDEVGGMRWMYDRGPVLGQRTGDCWRVGLRPPMSVTAGAGAVRGSARSPAP